MAIGQTRVNGGTTGVELVGRDLKFVLVASTGVDTSYTAVDSNLEAISRVLQQYCTITVIGTPASGNVRYVVEGLAANASVLASALAGIGNAAPTVTVNDNLSGTTFA